MKNFVLKGYIAYSENKDQIITIPKGFVVCKNGKVVGTFQNLPKEYKEYPIFDYGKQLIIPGMTDLHVHAPQYSFRGIGLDLELLDWLSTHTFPEEAKYCDIEYAKRAYKFFVEDLKRTFSTRAVIFATRHNEATIELMNQLEKTGLITYVGKVNMDRNSNEELDEESAEASLKDTKAWLETIQGKYKRTMPILTPRFIPSCSDELMKGIGQLAKEKGLRIQSHLSENKSEIAWVKELVPQAEGYGHAYELFDNMGDQQHPTIMAHCVYSDEKEMEILKNHGAYVAHCADSNMNLTSGIAPVRKFLDAGIHVGLGTDVAAGSSMNMLQTMMLTLQASKMYYRLVDQNCKKLSFEEVFYLATEGGGSYFGQVGSFKPGYDFDVVVIDDSTMHSMRDLSIRERIERICFNNVDCQIQAKYVAGKNIYQKKK